MPKLLFSFLLTITCCCLFAQNFIPLLSTDKNETIFDAVSLPNKKVAVLSYQNADYFSFYSEKPSFEIFKDQLQVMDSVFTKLSIVSRNGILEDQISFYSTQDSIFGFEQLKVFGDEIVMWGSVFTANHKTKAAVWLNFDLEINNTIVYDYNLDFSTSVFFNNSYFFNINSNGNILCASSNGTLELDRFGNLVKTYNNGYIQFPFIIDANENYIHPEPQYQRVFIYSPNSGNGYSIAENQNYDRGDIGLESYELALNNSKSAFYVNTLFRNGCAFTGSKSAILKYNISDFSSEIFYEDPTPNCLTGELGQFDIDVYQDDHIYFANKAETCGFIPPENVTRNCKVEYINLFCLDEAGNLRWSKYLGGDALYRLNGVIATADKGCIVYVKRYEQGVNKQYEADSYYLKFDKNGNVVEPLSTHIPEQEANNYNIQIYPNPAYKWLYLNILDDLLKEQLTLNIFNLKGQLVLAQKLNNTAINIQYLANGNYTYAISNSSKKIKSGKFIKL